MIPGWNWRTLMSDTFLSWPNITQSKWVTLKNAMLPLLIKLKIIQNINWYLKRTHFVHIISPNRLLIQDKFQSVSNLNRELSVVTISICLHFSLWSRPSFLWNHFTWWGIYPRARFSRRFWKIGKFSQKSWSSKHNFTVLHFKSPLKIAFINYEWYHFHF